MKPNLTFLAKVRDGEVFWRRGYSVRRGGFLKFVGGEAVAQKHADAGLIVMPYHPRAGLGQPALATLTDAGRALLEPKS